MQQQTKALLLALTAIFFWSTVAVPFKIGLREFHYIHFLFITISIAVLVTGFTLVYSGRWKELKQVSHKSLFMGVLGGFLNPFLYYLMLFKAYSLLPAQIAQALNYTWPIMLVLLSVPFLGQKLNLISVLTLLIGFAGVYLISSEGQPWPLEPSSPLGVVLAVSTSVIWAVFWLINTKAKASPMINLFINFVTGWLLALPLAIAVPFNYSLNAVSWVAVAYSGIFEMGITFIIWLTAMRLTSRTDKISNYVFLSPFLSLLFISMFLDEEIYVTTLIGLFLIIASIFLNRHFEAQEKKML